MALAWPILLALGMKRRPPDARSAHRPAPADPPDPAATPRWALSEILEDGVNLALWQRQLPLHIAEFGALLVALNAPLAESLVIELGQRRRGAERAGFSRKLL